MTVNLVGKAAGLTSLLNCQEGEKQEDDGRYTADNRERKVKSLRLEHKLLEKRQRLAASKVIKDIKL